MVLLFYTTYISVDLAHHEIFRAKVGMGGIIVGISSCIFSMFSAFNVNHILIIPT